MKFGAHVFLWTAKWSNDSLPLLDKAKALGLKPMAKVKSYAAGGIDPAYMGMGVIPAVGRALKAAG